MPKDWDTENLSNNIEKQIRYEVNKNPEFKIKNKIGRTIAKTFKKEILYMASMTIFADS